MKGYICEISNSNNSSNTTRYLLLWLSKYRDTTKFTEQHVFTVV